jgi:hypothetical protein
MATSAATSYTVDSLDGFDARAVFSEGKDQVVVAVRITPVFSQVDLSLLSAVLDVANERGFALVREQPFRDEWLLCVFEAYDDVD